MALEIIQLHNLPKLNQNNYAKTLLKAIKWFVIIALICAVIGGLYTGKFWRDFWGVILIFTFFFSIPWFIAVAIYGLIKAATQSNNRKIHFAKEQALKSLGFNADFSVIGLVVDQKNQKMAFTLDAEPHAFVCDFSDVREWYSGSNERTVDYSNHEGAYAGSKTYTFALYVVVRIADPNYPELIFVVGNQQEQSQWIARLNALING